MELIGTHHTGFSVTNLKRSTEFYQRVFGCEVIWEREIRDPYFREIVGIPDCVVRGAQLRLPPSEHILELFEYSDPRGEPLSAQPNQPGWGHLAVLVADLRPAYNEMRAAGIGFVSPPVLITAGANRGGWSVYMRDPDGIIIELFQPPLPRP